MPLVLTVFRALVTVNDKNWCIENLGTKRAMLHPFYRLPMMQTLWKAVQNILHATHLLPFPFPNAM